MKLRAAPPCPVCAVTAAGLGFLSSFALGVAVGRASKDQATIVASTCARHRPEMIHAIGRAHLAVTNSERPIGEPAVPGGA